MYKEIAFYYTHFRVDQVIIFSINILIFYYMAIGYCLLTIMTTILYNAIIYNTEF